MVRGSEFLSNKSYPLTLGRSLDEAEAITARWQEATREYSDWLDISSKFNGWYSPRA